MSNTKFQHIENTDGQYRVWYNNTHIGNVCKVYSGRSAVYWAVYAVGEKFGGPRVGWDSRRAAAHTLVMKHLSKIGD